MLTARTATQAARFALARQVGLEEPVAAVAPEGLEPSPVPMTPDEILALAEQSAPSVRAAVAATGAAASPSVVSASASGAAGEDLIHRVEQMVAASETRQQQQLALRVSQVLHDVDSQHQADIARIERTVSPVAGLTAQEIQEQRQMLNYLMRVSQTQ